jgi:hypothetical protein
MLQHHGVDGVLSISFHDWDRYDWNIGILSQSGRVANDGLKLREL